MTEITARRKNRSFNTEHRNIFRLRLNEKQSNEILFNESATNLLGLNNDSALMFAFVRSGNYGYLWKESIDKDNYKVNTKANAKGVIIYTRELQSFFKTTFKIRNRVTRFEIKSIPDRKNRFKFVMIE